MKRRMHKKNENSWRQRIQISSRVAQSGWDGTSKTSVTLEEGSTVGNMFAVYRFFRNVCIPAKNYCKANGTNKKAREGDKGSSSEYDATFFFYLPLFPCSLEEAWLGETKTSK